jgi:DNA-binding response OmpR family regulator
MKQVLVVDDDTDLLEMVSVVLKNYDLEVSCLSGGSGLFQSLADNKPDIILMDIYLGDADGRELCRNLKNSKEYQEIPVILYSAGNVTPSSIQESKANDFISKPFDVSHLVKRIRYQSEKPN